MKIEDEGGLVSVKSRQQDSARYRNNFTNSEVLVNSAPIALDLSTHSG